MPPNSNTSSMEPQNGSAYDHSQANYSLSGSITDTTNLPEYRVQARYPAGGCAPRPTQQPMEYTRAGTHDYQYHDRYNIEQTDSDSCTTGYQSQEPFAYESLSSPVEAPMETQQYDDHGRYYLPVTTYDPQETPTYDNELTIEGEQAAQATQAAPEHQYQTYYDATGIRTEQPLTVTYFTQHPSQTTDAVSPHPTDRWSAEYSPEERMRLGLPRWESKQHRIMYEEGR